MMIRNGTKWLNNLWGQDKAKEVQKAWKFVFNKDKEEVKTILKDLAIYCNVYKSSFARDSKEQTAFNEGARDVFLHIMEMISLDFEELIN